MSAHHFIDGLMQVTKSRNFHQLGILVGLESATISRMHKGKQDWLSGAMINQVQIRTAIPFDTMFTWFRLPKEAVLGRVANVESGRV